MLRIVVHCFKLRTVRTLNVTGEYHFRRAEVDSEKTRISTGDTQLSAQPIAPFYRPDADRKKGLPKTVVFGKLRALTTGQP